MAGGYVDGMLARRQRNLDLSWQWYCGPHGTTDTRAIRVLKTGVGSSISQRRYLGKSGRLRGDWYCCQFGRTPWPASADACADDDSVAEQLKSATAEELRALLIWARSK